MSDDRGVRVSWWSGRRVGVVFVLLTLAGLAVGYAITRKPPPPPDVVWLDDGAFNVSASAGGPLLDGYRGISMHGPLDNNPIRVVGVFPDPSTLGWWLNWARIKSNSGNGFAFLATDESFTADDGSVWWRCERAAGYPNRFRLR